MQEAIDYSTKNSTLNSLNYVEFVPHDLTISDYYLQVDTSRPYFLQAFMAASTSCNSYKGKTPFRITVCGLEDILADPLSKMEEESRLRDELKDTSILDVYDSSLDDHPDDLVRSVVY